MRADATRDAARADGFETCEVTDASRADVICLLVPDDVIPTLDLQPKADSLVVVASGYTLAFDRIDPPGDAVMVAPRMLGPEVRRCYEEGIGFITAIGVHRDATGTAQPARSRSPAPSAACARAPSSSARATRRSSTWPPSRRSRPR